MNEQWQELKETIIELRDNDGVGTQQEVCKFLANLMDVLEKQMNSSENPNKWILVSERLPEDEQKVLVTTRSGNLIDVDTNIFYHASAFWEHYVTAWMPLPTPYKEEDKG